MLAVTGLGSLPGLDFPAAVRMTSADVPTPYLPELPARGPHATMVGRGIASLVGLSAELTDSGWRMTSSPGRDQRRAIATLRDDLDMLAEQMDGYEGPLWLSLIGPWTLCTSVELGRGGRALSDPGARRDMATSLWEGTIELLAGVQNRMPNVSLSFHLDEPSLPAVLGGQIPTVGGLFRVAAIDQAEAFGALQPWATLPGGQSPRTSVVHCCAGGLNLWDIVRLTGLGGVSIDTSTLTIDNIDELAAILDSGAQLLLGVAGSPQTPVSEMVTSTWTLLENVGVTPEHRDQLVITPACGLAQWTPAQAQKVWSALRAVADEVDDRLHA